MSTLLLIRHGQASFGEADYDRLSALGKEQGLQIGAYFGALDIRFDRVFVGPRLRHRQTHSAAAQTALERGSPFPEPEHLGSFDEHQCLETLDYHRQSLTERLGLSADATDRKSALKLFRQGSLMWVRGELESPGPLEDWPTFLRRIQGDLADIQRRITEPNARIGIFTSGGAIAAAVGTVLGLSDEKIIELSWSIRNGSLTEIRLSKRGLSLAGFNAVPFRDPKLLTYV